MKTLCWTVEEERRKDERNYFSHLAMSANCPHLHAPFKNRSLKHKVIGKIDFFLTFLAIWWRILRGKRRRRSIFCTFCHLFFHFFFFFFFFCFFFFFLRSIPFLRRGTSIRVSYFPQMSKFLKKHTRSHSWRRIERIWTGT